MALSVVVVGCSSDRQSTEKTDANSPDSVQTFDGRGLVTSIVPNRKHLVVDHEDIPGFMSAMKMPYPVADTSLATGIVEGDSISFTVEVEGSNFRLVRIAVDR